MDLILSLTHFCEVHGPTSIICSQVLPFSCSQCYPDTLDLSPDITPATSHETASSHGLKHRVSNSSSSASSSKRPSLSSPRIEDHPYFLKDYQKTSASPPNTDKPKPVGGADGDTCASCSLTLPEGVSKQLPSGAPGTATRDGKGRNGCPVLRSRELVYSCGNGHPPPTPDSSDDCAHDPHTHSSFPDSLQSSSVSSDSSSCHTHMLTYLSLRGPPDPADYALLRRSSIRTLSCELLPRGLSSGPLCFGDSVTGYTIAYIFRLSDPMARGKRRSYALVALAGKDAGRAFRACPLIWRAFGRIATWLVNSAEKNQEEQKQREEMEQTRTGPNSNNSNNTNKVGGKLYTPVSSFLTGRAVDPDGQLRRPGQIRARNLAQIVGNEYIFAELHAHFVALLQQLGSMFGGVPISEERFVCSTVREGRESNLSSSSSQPVMVSTENDTSDRKDPQSPLDCDDSSDFGMSNLDQNKQSTSTGPKPIPIVPRRPVMA